MHLQEHHESIEMLKFMFSDEMKRWDFNNSNQNFSKDVVVVVITDKNLYLLRRKDLRLIKTISLINLSSILIITENSSIFVLKFEG
jgi:hypothetical protein